MTRKVGEYILKEAGLKASADIDKLQQMPWREYYDIAMRGAEKYVKDSGIKSLSAMKIFQPHVDGKVIPQHPYSPVHSPHCG